MTKTKLGVRWEIFTTCGKPFYMVYITINGVEFRTECDTKRGAIALANSTAKAFGIA